MSWNLSWDTVWDNLLSLGIAFVLTLPMAIEREAHSRSAGLRTFPLVAVASCGYMLVGISALGGSPEANARIFYGLMTGIGFIGGGAIFKASRNVHGTATAASIWNTGAIGASVAFRRLEIAVVLSLLNLAILWIGPSLKDEVQPED